MESLIDATGNANIIRRLEALQSDAPCGWGKMNAAQMLAHCQKPFQVASGELKLKRGLIGFLFGRLAKKKFVDSDAPFNKNSPTHPRFLEAAASDIDRERKTLVRLIRGFEGRGPLTRDPHPFFGTLTSEDWDRLLWKHMDHHLRQFGV